MTGRELVVRIRNLQELHGAAYPGTSGLRHLQVATWSAPLGVANILTMVQEWVRLHCPEALRRELSKVDWSQPQVVVTDLSGSELAGLVLPAEAKLTWLKDKLGRKPKTTWQSGHPEGLRRLLHRLAACVPEETKEPWYEGFEAAGPVGQASFIAFDEAGQAVVTPAGEAA